MNLKTLPVRVFLCRMVVGGYGERGDGAVMVLALAAL